MKSHHEKTVDAKLQTFTEQQAGKLLDAVENAGDGWLLDEVNMVRTDTQDNGSALITLLHRIDEGHLRPESIATFDEISNGPIL